MDKHSHRLEWFSPQEQPALLDFWSLYEAHYEGILEETMKAALAHPELAPLVAAMPPAQRDEQNRRSRAMLRRAVETGDWSEYAADVSAQGVAFAETGLSFAAWYDLVGAFQDHLMPLFATAYGGAPDRMAAAIKAMRTFVDRAMVLIGQAYIVAKERLLARSEESKRLLEALHLSEERYQLIVEAIDDYAIFMLDPAGNVASWNAGAERIKGYRAEEILGKHFSCFYPPGEEGKARAALETATAKGRWEDEGWRVRKDGSRFWADAVLTPLYGEGRRLRGFAKITRDFSERRRKEEELAAMSRFLDSIVENIPAMLFVKDAKDLCFVRLNRAGEELLGWKRDALLGKNDYDFFPREQADAYTAKDREVLAQGTLHDVAEEPIDTAHGRRYLHTRKIAIPGSDGAPLYLLGISQDVTDARETKANLDVAYRETARLNALLEEQNRELVAASRAKSDFLAMMSHELRTPLNAIIGFSEVLIDGKFGGLNERQSRYLRNVYDGGRHLLSLINDLLDLSKIEAGRLDVVRRPCAPHALVDEAIGTLQSLADARHVTLSLEEPAGRSGAVAVDPLRGKQVLYNLLSNAIKFSPEGGHVTVIIAPVDGGRFVRVTVSDNGPGISSDDLARLFKPFSQLGGAKSAQGGTGLGLALTKRLVELMGGRVGVESAPGSGSRFHVDLEAVPETAYPSAPRVESSGDLVMIVDDDPAARELLDLTLQASGYRTMLVESGEAALRLAREHRPAIVTLDVFLPGIDGWDVLRGLRGDPTTADIPVVLVTISSDRRKAFGLGALELLIKPIDRASLIEVLDRRSFTTKVKQREVHVLAVDDDPGHIELVRAALEPRGFRVSAAETGRGGLALAEKHSIDLLLLDLVLPDISGVEVVEALRARERTRDLPILLVTGKDLSAADRRRLNGDVEAVLAKGTLTVEQLVAEIDRVARRW